MKSANEWTNRQEIVNQTKQTNEVILGDIIK